MNKDLCNYLDYKKRLVKYYSRFDFIIKKIDEDSGEMIRLSKCSRSKS